MTYTFWHCGILIGESDLEEPSDLPGQHSGVFRATPYGTEVFPRLSGILSAAHGLTMHLDADGLSVDEMDKQAIETFLDTTAAGQRIIDIGRMLSEVEIRALDGSRLDFASIAFNDLMELRRLIADMDVDGASDLDDLPLDAPRYVVSATLREVSSASDGRGARSSSAN